jgi:hypothetical protein
MLQQPWKDRGSLEGCLEFANPACLVDASARSQFLRGRLAVLEIGLTAVQSSATSELWDRSDSRRMIGCGLFLCFDFGSFTRRLLFVVVTTASSKRDAGCDDLKVLSE